MTSGTMNILKQEIVSEATNRASYDSHLFKCDKWYPKYAQQIR